MAIPMISMKKPTTMNILAMLGIDLNRDNTDNFSPLCLLILLSGLRIRANLSALTKLMSPMIAGSRLSNELETIMKSRKFHPSLR